MNPEDARLFQFALEYDRYHTDDDTAESLQHHRAGMEVAYLTSLDREEDDHA